MTAITTPHDTNAMKNIRVILALAAFLLTTSCVSKSKYQELEKLKAEDAASLASSQAKVQDLELIIAQLEQRLGAASDDKESLQASVTQMREALAEANIRKQEVEKRIKEYQDLVRRFKALTDTGQLSVKIVDGRMVVGLPSDVLFGSGSAKLSKDGEETIMQVTKLLNEIQGREYQVEGHTDNVPIRTAQFPSNWELSAARGLNVVHTMIRAGMPEDRISASSFGDRRPIANNESAEGRRANRRIEIVIVPDLSTLPGYEELKKMSESAEKS